MLAQAEQILAKKVAEAKRIADAEVKRIADAEVKRIADAEAKRIAEAEAKRIAEAAFKLKQALEKEQAIAAND
jgi:hypothetical protein